MARAATARRGLLASAGGSPGGISWSASSVGRTSSSEVARPSSAGSSSSRTRSAFGEGSWRLRFSSTCTPGWRCSTTTSSVAVTSTKNASCAVGDQQPGRVVRAGIDGRAEGLDGGGRGGVARRARGAAHRGIAWPRRARRAAAGWSARRPRRPRWSPTTCRRRPRRARRGWPVRRLPSSRVIGIAGRARRSSRLAATISGIPGTTPLITIKRHIGGSVRAWGATGGARCRACDQRLFPRHLQRSSGVGSCCKDLDRAENARRPRVAQPGHRRPSRPYPPPRRPPARRHGR